MIQASGLAFGNNGNIHGPTELVVVMSEKLSYPTFESIPTNCVADLATHGYTEAGVVPTRADNHNKMGRVITLSFLPGPLVFTGLTDPSKPGKVLLTVHPMVRLLN
jgi:hypothetical protein